MSAVLGDLGRALGQLTEPAFAGVLLKSVGLTIALLVGLHIAMVSGLAWILPDSLNLPWLGSVGLSMGLVTLTALVSVLLLSTVLMLPVATLFVGFFLDDIAAAVEARHYPHLPAIDPLPLSDTILDGVRLFALVVLANAVALVIYLISNIFAPLVFWAVNGLLLGTEYFQLVAARRVGRAQARALRKAHFGRVWLAGALMAVPLTVPLVNLLVPLVGVATFTHLFHRLEAEG